MRRISTATRVIDKFGSGKDGFTNGDAVAGLPATDLEDAWFDHVQEEIAGVVESAGIALDTSNRGQLLAAIQSMFASVVGSVRNLSMSVAAASATATMTADEIIVATALAGRTYRLAGFNKAINLATTGAGGMDTGSPPVSGFVALYAIFNPTTNTSALLATNATSAKAPEVYGGGNMPSGYTASALVSVWKTNASGQFIIARQKDRSVSFPSTGVLSTSTVAGSYTSLSISAAVPLNAVSCTGLFSTASTAGSALNGSIAGDTAGSGQQSVSSSGAVSTGLSTTCNFQLQIFTPQAIYYIFTSSAGTPTFFVSISSYQF